MVLGRTSTWLNIRPKETGQHASSELQAHRVCLVRVVPNCQDLACQHFTLSLGLSNLWIARYVHWSVYILGSLERVSECLYSTRNKTDSTIAIGNILQTFCLVILGFIGHNEDGTEAKLWTLWLSVAHWVYNSRESTRTLTQSWTFSD